MLKTAANSVWILIAAAAAQPEAAAEGMRQTHPDMSPPWAVQESDREGFTRLPGEHYVSARARPWVVRRIEGVVRGRLDSEDPSFPLPFSVVELRGPGVSRSIRRVFADARGRFEALDLSEGVYDCKILFFNFLPIEAEVHVSASAPEGMLQVEMSPARFLAGDLRGFTRSPSEHIINEVDEELVLSDVAGKAIGSNLGPEGWEMEGVLIEIMGPEDSDTIRYAVSESDGRFRFSDCAPGRYRWKATAFGFQSVTGRLVVRPGAEKTQDWKVIMRVGT